MSVHYVRKSSNEKLRTQFASFSATSIVRLVTCGTMNVSTSLSIGIGNKIPYNFIPLEPKHERPLPTRFRIIRSSHHCYYQEITLKICVVIRSYYVNFVIKFTELMKDAY
jgi:hypothetical protein